MLRRRDPGPPAIRGGERLASRARPDNFVAAARLLAAGLPLAALERLAACRAVASATHDSGALLWIAEASARAHARLEQPERGMADLAAAIRNHGPAAPALLRWVAARTLAQLHITLRQPEAALAICRAIADEELPGLATDPADGGRAGKLPEIPSIGHTLAGLQLVEAAAAFALGEPGAAEAAATQAVAAFDRLRDGPGAGAARYELGRAIAARDGLQEARDWLSAALGLDTAGDRPWAEARDHAALAELAERQGDAATALEHGAAALTILWNRVGPLDRGEVARLCRLFGTILSASGDQPLAIQCLSRASAYYAQVGDMAAEAAAAAALDAALRAPRGRSAGSGLPAKWRSRVRELSAVFGLADEMASTHPHLERHASVVTTYALAFGRHTQIDADQAGALVQACRLYHIGRSAAGDGPAQPVLGADMLATFRLLPEATVAAVRHHQERWDGTGVPDGLVGEEIPLLARLLAVVDTYVSNCFDPAEPLPHSAALAVLHAQAGTSHDPEVVGKFAEMHWRAVNG